MKKYRTKRSSSHQENVTIENKEPTYLIRAIILSSNKGLEIEIKTFNMLTLAKIIRVSAFSQKVLKC